MNLFWKKFLGKLQSTSKFESNYTLLKQEYDRYQSVLQSQELEEYLKLYDIVKSAEFKDKKTKLRNRKYKDTEYYGAVHEMIKLKRNKELRAYREIAHSQILCDFLAFKETEDFVKLGNPELVKEDPKLQEMKEFEKSKEYEIYTRFLDSYILKEYRTLRDKIKTPEFQEANAFWENKKRWETTEEYQQEVRYCTLSNNPDIKYYNKVKAEKFKELHDYEMVVKEGFDWNTLNSSKWEYGFHHESPSLITNYSFADQEQGFADGENVRVEDGILHIKTKKEKITARAWDERLGFITKDFNYSSDVIHGRNTIHQNGGIIRAKIRCTGNANVSHRFWLAGDQKTPLITIFKAEGKRIRFGTRWTSNKGIEEAYELITGINPADFYIYTLKWTDKELVWEINNYEVLRTTDGLTKDKLFPMLNSYITQGLEAGNAEFEVDWIEVFQHKDIIKNERD